MKKLFTVVLLLGVFLKASAQNPLTVSGKIRDSSGKSLEFATVSLHKQADSSVVKSRYTDENGAFVLENVPQGVYFLKAAMIGFYTYISPSVIVNAENASVSLSDIVLVPSENHLSEVTVTAKKPFLERQIDKLVINVESNITMAGNNALEILDKIPGVRTDADGNVSVYGKQGIQIFMDGKPSNLSAADLAAMLRGMQASQIEKIEVITNPSARYDATGNTGIINLVMKRDKRFGTNGSATVAAARGLHWRQNAGFNLNYRNRNLSTGMNVSQGVGDRENRAFITRNFGVLTADKQFFDQKATTVTAPFTRNIKLTADYYAGKKTVIGAAVGWTGNTFDTRILSDADLKNAEASILVRNHSDVKNLDKWNNLTFNANLRMTLDSQGREFSADFDWLIYNQQLKQNSVNTTPFVASGTPTPPYLLRGDLPSLINVRSFKADYVHPLSASTRFEAGIKTSFVDNDGDARYYLTVAEGEIPDPGRTNHFLYFENVNAAYVNLNTRLGKTSLQMGLRAEQTRLKGNLVTYDTTFYRNYLKLFPTVFVSRTLGTKHTLSISGGRRIQRPNYQDLNPFRFFLDLYTYREGNPDLQPQFSYNTELTYGFNQKIFLNVYFNRETQRISTVLSQNDETKVAAQTQLNLSDGRTMGYNLSVPVDVIRSKWSANLFFNHWSDRLRGNVRNDAFDNEQSSFLIQMTNNLILGKNWVGEFGGYYVSRQLYGTFVFEPQWQLNAGIQKKVWNKKGTIRLNANDIFLTQKQKMSVTYANVDMLLRRRLDTRFVTLAFSYNFGNSSVQGTRRRNGGADEERNRIQAGTSA